MGQTIGRAPLLPGPKHFTNLPKSNIYELWEAFNDIAEGFGLTVDEFLEILRVCLKDYLEYSEKKLDQIGKAVFTTLDDDANDLIDALEFLAAFAIMSGMTPNEISFNSAIDAQAKCTDGSASAARTTNSEMPRFSVLVAGARNR